MKGGKVIECESITEIMGKNIFLNKSMILLFIFFSIFILNIKLVYAESENNNIDGVPLVYMPIEKNYSQGVTIVPEYIIIHDTGNRGQGANAKANRNYFNTTDREASAQFIVDDKEIVQALPSTTKAWHIGDGKQQTNANNGNSIGIELCVNSDGDFGVTFQSGIKLTRYLMNKYNIPAENVIRHYDATKKICPRIMIEDDPSLWIRFKEEISKKEIIKDREIIQEFLKVEEKKSNYIIPTNPNARLIENDVVVKLQPSNDIESIDFIQQGSFIEVKEKIGDTYCKINYNGKEGYIPIDNVKLFEEFNYNKKGNIVESVNLRKKLVKILSFGVIDENTMSR